MYKTTSHISGPARTCAYVAAVLAGLIMLLVSHSENRTGIVDRMLRDARVGRITTPSSGRIVLVTVDDDSIRHTGPWPWPRSRHASLVDRLRIDGADRVMFDMDFSTPAADPFQDAAFASALDRFSGHVYLAGGLSNPSKDLNSEQMPPAGRLADKSLWMSIVTVFDKDTVLRRLSWVATAPQHRVIPSMSLAATRHAGKPVGDSYDIDWTIDPTGIPTYRYEDVLAGRVPAKALRGRTVMIGLTAQALGDIVIDPRFLELPSVYGQIAGAETLLRGEDAHVPQIFVLAVVFGLMATALLSRQRIVATPATIAILAAMPVVQLVVETHVGPRLDIDASVWMLAASIAAQMASLIFGYLRGEPMRFEMTGIPNMNAMRRTKSSGRTVGVLRQRNYVETTALLGFERQSRLMQDLHGILEKTLRIQVFQVDVHTLAWRSKHDAQTMRDEIEAIVGQVSSGHHMGDRMVDTIVVGGISDQPGLEMGTNVNYAIMAAEQAVRCNQSVMVHRLDDENDEWKASVLTELDRAIVSGDVWVAYQPKVDTTTGTITGCEALVRWTHPTRGVIRPDWFIPVVESAGRIEKLTIHILDTALHDMRNRGISVAVNISMSLIGRGRLAPMISDALARHAFDPKRLILEITESAEMGGAAGTSELRMIADTGVRISIDDYGTGNSTLSYLQTMPVSELKIDKSFIRPMLASERNGTLVESSIKLAHALGMTVVAEGVETSEILDRLVAMDCDMVQGWHIGRPVPIGDLPVVLPDGAIRTRRELQSAGDKATRRPMEIAVDLDASAIGAIVQGIAAPVFVKDHATRRIMFVNEAFEDLGGMTAEKIVGRTIHEILLPGESAPLERQENELVDGGATVVREHKVTLGDGRMRTLKLRLTLRSDKSGRRIIVGLAEDVTEDRRAMDRLAHMAMHDPLTGALNRTFFHETLEKLLDRDVPTGVIYVDLDNFKRVNDVHGHAGGDTVLVETTHRLHECTRCHVARLGGDEFAILVENAHHAEDLGRAAVAALNAPFIIDGRPVIVGGSVGVAVHDPKDGDAEELLRRADGALYRAKQDGRGVCRMDRRDEPQSRAA